MCLEVHFFNNLVRDAENMVASTPDRDGEAALADVNGAVRERHFKHKGVKKKMKDSPAIRQSPKRKIKDISKQKSKVKKKKVVASGMASDNRKKETDSRDTQMQKPTRKRKLRILDVDSDRDESTPPSANISNTETIDPANSGKKAENNVYKRKRLVKCSNYVPTLQFNEPVEEKVNPLPEVDEMMI
ncbi:hypothetical protein ACET3Z_021289 [Daucus carota]